jgi:hypothetical protein
MHSIVQDITENINRIIKLQRNCQKKASKTTQNYINQRKKRI